MVRDVGGRRGSEVTPSLICPRTVLSLVGWVPSPPHFRAGKTEAQRGQVLNRRSQGQASQGSESDPGWRALVGAHPPPQSLV